MSKIMMRTMVALAIIAVFGCAVFAQGLPSSKATAQINTLVKCTMSTATSDDGTAVLPSSCVDLYGGEKVNTENEWIEIMSKPVKLSNSQSLFVSPSLVSGLYTRTRTKTTTGTTSTAVAMGAVYLRAALLDQAGNEIEAAPTSSCTSNIFGCVDPASNEKFGVVLDSRLQSLTQDLSTCVIDVTSIDGTNNGSCTFTSVIDLITSTASANTFNFIFPNVGQGTYTLKIYAAVASSAEVIGSGSSVGAAAFGLGSVTAESVRLVHDFEF